MIHARLSEAAQWSGAEHFGQNGEFFGIEIDSRRVTPGSPFWSKDCVAWRWKVSLRNLCIATDSRFNDWIRKQSKEIIFT